MYTVQVRSLNDVIEYSSGVAKCPFNVRQNSSYVMTADGDLYTATATDFAGRDVGVYRDLGPSRRLRTAQYNSRWLNGI